VAGRQQAVIQAGRQQTQNPENAAASRHPERERPIQAAGRQAVDPASNAEKTAGTVDPGNGRTAERQKPTQQKRRIPAGNAEENLAGRHCREWQAGTVPEQRQAGTQAQHPGRQAGRTPPNSRTQTQEVGGIQQEIQKLIHGSR